jgi:hypothetical protein
MTEQDKTVKILLFDGNKKKLCDVVDKVQGIQKGSTICSSTT